MRGHARDIRGSVGLLTTSILLGACGGWGDDLVTVEHLPLTTPVGADATLHIESSDRFLIGEPGQLRRVEPGATVATFTIADIATPYVIAVLDDGIVVHAGDRLLRLSPDGELMNAEDDMEESLFAMDPRGRWIVQAAGSGAVFGHSTATLTPVWGWASLGERTTGFAVSPHGGTVVQAIPGELLIRDLQTGRTLETMEVAAPFRQLTSAGSGRIYGIGGTEGRATVFAVQMAGEEPSILWRRTLDDLDLGEDAEVRLSPIGDRLVVFAPGKKGGLRMLDAETGEALGSILEGPIDVGYGPGGHLFMLYPGAIRKLR